MGAHDADLIRVEKRGGQPVSTGQRPAVVDDSIRFRISNEDEDWFGDVVVQSGLEFPPSVPAVADHAHRLEASVGEWRNVERAGRETFATLRLLPVGKSRLADLVRCLYEGGYPIAASVFFDTARRDMVPISRGGKPIRPDHTGPWRYTRCKVREITLTQFPANPAAIAVARSLGFNDDELAALSRTEPLPTSHPPTSATQAVARATPSRGTTMTLAEQIAAAQAAHEAALGTLSTATQALEADQSEANLTAVQRATTEVDTAFNRLTVLRSAESAAARRAAGAAATAPAAATTAVARAVAAVASPGAAAAATIQRRGEGREVTPGTRLAQIIIARSVAFETRRPLEQVAQEMFAQEPEVLAIARTAVGVADATTAGWAAELVRTETRAMLQVDLLPLSAWAALAASGVTINFNGAQSVVVPQMDVGKTVGGAWVGEGGAIPLVKGNLGAKRLSRYKLGGIVPITKELERTSDPNAVEVMRRFLRQVLSNLLDTSLIGNGPEVAGVKPAGLLFGVTPIAGAPGGGQAAVNADVQALLAAFTTANVRGRFALIMSEMALVRLGMMTNALGQVVFPEANGENPRVGNTRIIASPHIADTTVIAVSTDHFASAFDPLEADVNEAATLVAANADAVAPTHATGAAGAIGTALQVPPDGGIAVSGSTGAAAAGAVAISMYQTWSLALRMVMPASFGVTKAGAVQAVTGITW